MQKIVLLDGGLGQEIFRRSGKPAHPLWSVQVMMEQPEVVQAVYQDFIKAGARIITLNTYSATPTRLRRDGQLEWFEKLQRKALAIAQDARDESGAAVQIAGCLPPLVGSYSPGSAPAYADSLEEYRQITAIESQGVDLFICETMSSIAEGRAAAEAALETGRKTLLSFTLADDGSNRLRSGEPLEDALREIQDLKLNGILLNCSLPEVISRAMEVLKTSNLPFGGYANGFTSVEALKPGGTVDALSAREDLTPEKYADFVMEWVKSGATIVGGCCEVGPGHIARVRDRLEEAGRQITDLG